MGWNSTNCMNFVLLGFLRMILDILLIEEVEEIRDPYSCIFS